MDNYLILFQVFIFPMKKCVMLTWFWGKSCDIVLRVLTASSEHAVNASASTVAVFSL